MNTHGRAEKEKMEEETFSDGVEVASEKVTGQGFAIVDFEYDDVVAGEAELVASGRRRTGDRRICVCGHPAGRHTQVQGITLCKPTRMECPCKNLRAVLRAEDTRNFLRKTEGSGALHALGRGLRAAQDAGKSVEWLVEAKCDSCLTAAQVSPVAVTQRGIVVQSATGFDALLCRKCREEV